MSPLSRLLLSHQREVRRPQVIALHVHFLDYDVPLCHGSKSYSSGETVSGVSLLVLMTESTICRAAWMASHYPQQTPDL